MAYQALYRVWRPQTFDDIVGQEALIRTLKNAISMHKTSHAYLFTGPRGTGKTSAAKIFAKAMNCPNQKDGEPCNQCEICRAITSGALGDIVEIDAASNNGVDEMRDIRDKVRYAATQATYKVYIIDEVHMLSTGAFNALLKTLEEPPQNVVFILATTEPHKIPATIISRTQRFDFRRIFAEDIAKRLAYILTSEHISYEENALPVIARAANGGMRDALSLLDQAISYGNQSVSYSDALKVSGAIGQEQLLDYMQALHQQQVQEALAQLKAIFLSGKEAQRFVEELLIFTRDLIILASTKVSPDSLMVDATAFVNAVPIAYLYHIVDVLSQAQQMMRVSMQPDIYLEVVTVKLATKPAASPDVSALQAELAALKQQLAQQPVIAEPVAQVAAKKNPSVKQEAEFTPNLSKIFKVLMQATAQDKEKLQSEWSDILDCLSTSQRAKLNASTILAASPSAVVLGFEFDLLCSMTENDAQLKAEVDQHSQRLIQHACQIECVPIAQWKDVRSRFVQAKKAGVLNQYVSEDVIEIATEDVIEIETQEVSEFVQQAQQLFGEIVEVEE